MDFDVPADHSVSQRKRKERQVLRPCLRTKNAEEYESNGDTSCNWRTCNGLQGLGKRGWKSWKSEDESKSSKLQHC